jgi:uncharacterized protein YutD
MIIKRFFKDSDAEEVANLVKETMLTTNIKDYSNKYLGFCCKVFLISLF